MIIAKPRVSTQTLIEGGEIADSSWDEAVRVAESIEDAVQLGTKLYDAFEMYAEELLELAKDQALTRRYSATWVFGDEFARWLGRRQALIAHIS